MLARVNLQGALVLYDPHVGMELGVVRAKKKSMTRLLVLIVNSRGKDAMLTR